MKHRLLGVSILAAHHDDATIPLLTELAQDPEPAIAALALSRLWTLNPEWVIPLAAAAVKNRDVSVRRFGIRALIFRGDVAAIEEGTPFLAVQTVFGWFLEPHDAVLESSGLLR